MLLDVCTNVHNVSISLAEQSGPQHPLILRLRETCLTRVFLKKRLVAATDRFWPGYSHVCGCL